MSQTRPIDSTSNCCYKPGVGVARCDGRSYKMIGSLLAVVAAVALIFAIVFVSGALGGGSSTIWAAGLALVGIGCCSVAIALILKGKPTPAQQRQQVLNEVAQFIGTELSFLKEKLDALPPTHRLAICLWLMNIRDRVFILGHVSLPFYQSIIDFMRQLNENPYLPEPRELTFAANYYNEAKALLELATREKDLTIDVSEEEMLDAYINFDRLILLRNPFAENLLLGCGLGTCRLDQGGSKKEAHRYVDTVDIKLIMNPSVCCSWANPAQAAFFAGRYKFIYDEGPVVSYMQGDNERLLFYQNCKNAFIRNSSETLLILSTTLTDAKYLPPEKDFRKTHTPRTTDSYVYDKMTYACLH